MTDQPTISFNLFILSLAATAEIHLGSLAAPGSDTPGPVNLKEASHLIEVIAMLREKTAGNLDEQEERLIDSVLFDLRLRYVEASGQKPAAGGASAAPEAGSKAE